MSFSKYAYNQGENLYSIGTNEGESRRWYQRDIDQLIHSTAFRKLQRKSQLLSEKDPRSRSRLIHTLEVSRIAVEISERLGLNKELTEAISIGHDFATSPFGRVGNAFLTSLAGNDFSHELAATYMIETIAIKKVTSDAHLNVAINLFEDDPTLTRAVIDIGEHPYKISISRDNKDEVGYFAYHISDEILDGVRNHGEDGNPNTLEGQVVQYADNIAYLAQDIDDLFAAKIIRSSNDYTKYSAQKALKYYSENGVECSKKWDEIDGSFSDGVSLKKALNHSRGLRISSLISRFVDYNLKMLRENNLNFIDSKFFNYQIPKLICDEGLIHTINFIWYFTSKHYNNHLIRTSNNIQQCKIEQLWEILEDEIFKSKNVSYKNFLESLNDSRFNKFNNEWKKAYFISHLSSNEVDLIIDSFHQRDYTFEIDIWENNHDNC